MSSVSASFFLNLSSCGSFPFQNINMSVCMCYLQVQEVVALLSGPLPAEVGYWALDILKSLIHLPIDLDQSSREPMPIVAYDKNAFNNLSVSGFQTLWQFAFEHVPLSPPGQELINPFEVLGLLAVRLCWLTKTSAARTIGIVEYER